MNWIVYIAKSKTGFYYVGITTNVDDRIQAHNFGKGSRMAKQQGPFYLVYKSNNYQNKSLARKREAQIKKWSRLKKEKLISGEWN